MKNLFRASISQICYLRALFPEKVFSIKEYVTDVTVHALTPANEPEDGGDDVEILDEQAWALTRWLEGSSATVPLDFVFASSTHC